MKWFLVALVVVPGTIGDVLNSAGMKHQGELSDWSPQGLWRFLVQVSKNWYILVGIPAMALSFFALLALLSSTTLAFAVPATASSYILETAMAQYLLKEKVDWHRWSGSVLVAIGITLLAV
ncbi:MAG TPA: EamA family transporter [Terriglobales bacterium]|nr:EamA family transporter [Terriglobales bacterium]